MACWMSLRLAIVALVATLLATPALAKQQFVSQVDNFCQAFNNTTPLADLTDGMLTECTVCHASVFPTSFPDKGNVIPSAGAAYQAGKSSGDFSAFCPLATNSPPILAPMGSQTVNPGVQLVINVSASDPDGNGIVLAVAGAPAGHSFTDNGDGTAVFSWTPGVGQIGTHQVTFTATDDGIPMMSAMEAVTITVGQDNQPPVLAPIADQQVPVGSVVQIPVSARDPDGDAIVLSMSSLPSGASFSDAGNGTGSFDWVPGVVGNFALDVMATDAGTPPATATESFTLTVGNVNRPPVLTPIGDRSVDLGMTLQVRVTASDPDMDALSFSLAGGPPDATFADFGDGSAEILWTPTAAGSFNATLTVTDSGMPMASASETFALTARDPGAVDTLQLSNAFWSFGQGSGAVDSDDSDDSDKRRSSYGSDDSDDSDGAKPSYDSDDREGAGSGSNAGTLTVTGGGAMPGQIVSVFDAASGALLGVGLSDALGDFSIVLTPFLAPCSVQVGVDLPTSLPMTVQGAPAQCGSLVFTRVEKVKWSCGDGELEARGRQGPPQGGVTVSDEAGMLLLQGSVDALGRFDLEAPVTPSPARVEIAVQSGTGSWSLGTVGVSASKSQCALQPAKAKVSKRQHKKRRRHHKRRKHGKKKRKHGKKKKQKKGKEKRRGS